VTDTRGTVQKRSLFALIANLPSLLIEQVKNELELLRRELTTKLKHAGIGVGLIVGACAFLFFALGVLVAAAVLGLAVVLPAWAAALIVAGVLLVITAILVFAGVAQLKRGTPAAPTQTILNVRKDVNAIKGVGRKG
jgi:Flp pilus assembly protein TadB